MALTAVTGGEESAGTWLAMAETPAEPEAKQATAPPPETTAAEWTKPIPLSFSIDYTVVSDYIFRGINFSEYAGEGREKLNHQLGVGSELDAGEFGAFGVSVWFEWFAGQERLTPGDSSNLQEVDYAAWWAYEIEQIATSVELGWIAYQFPRLSGDAEWTNEAYVSLAFDDSALFKTQGPVLNPSVTYYWDLDDFEGAFMEVGVSHDFAFGEIDATRTAPVLKDMTLTPSATLGIDHRWMSQAVGNPNESTRLANIVYGLALGYDVSSAISMPEKYGSIGLTGFLNYSQALREELINDEFWGGVSASYSW